MTVPDGATGKVRIEINGKEYFEPIENGVARFKVENLTAGIKTVYASYVGDNNYTGNHTSANFTVKKHNPIITVNAIDINVGDVVLINVTAPVDVTRPVIVNVGGVDSGKYGVTIKYLGDDKYLTAHNTTGFKVSKVPSNITVVVNNITVGDVAIINMTVPKDATGNITVRVNNTVVVVGIVGGTAQAVVPYLKVGNYTVHVTYNGDNKYLSSTNATKLTVNKVSTGIEVIDQGNGTVVVIVPGNATGNVTIVVENKTFNGTVVNGTAIINLTNVTPGVHNITVIYSGDTNHTNATVNATVLLFQNSLLQLKLM